MLQEWRERPLGEIAYLYVDARYEKVREAGQVRDAAVLVASGITPQGERQVSGVSVSLSEHEMHWKAFLRSLNERGMHGVKLVISDNHEGLGAARRAVLGSVPWQRCQFHLQQNAGAYLPRQSMRMEVAAEIRAMLKAANLPDIRVHDLRHTAATLMLQQNTHPKIVQSHPGHSQTSLTMDTYSHVIPDMQNQIADKLDELLAPTAIEITARDGAMENEPKDAFFA